MDIQGCHKQPYHHIHLCDSNSTAEMFRLQVIELEMFQDLESELSGQLTGHVMFQDLESEVSHLDQHFPAKFLAIKLEQKML